SHSSGPVSNRGPSVVNAGVVSVARPASARRTVRLCMTSSSLLSSPACAVGCARPASGVSGRPGYGGTGGPHPAFHPALQGTDAQGRLLAILAGTPEELIDDL